jgi:hypothetical protein
MYQIKFKDFTSVDAYCQLQRYFLGRDYRGHYLEKSKENPAVAEVMKIGKPLNNPEIVVYSRDDDQNEVYTAEKFEEDFLFPQIAGIASAAFKALLAEMSKKGIITEEQVQSFTLSYLNQLVRSRDKIKQADYLSGGIKETLYNQYDQLEEVIRDFLKDPFPYIKQKLQFKWSRTDVIYFFHLLRKNRVIEYMSDADLGRVIDNAVEYRNEADGKYEEIKNSRKHLNAYLNTEGRPEDPALNRIKRIFQSEDFYNN